MKNKELQPYFIMIGLFIITSFALAYTIDVSIKDEAGVRTNFPAIVGEWTGEELRFCQNPDHRGDYAISELGENIEVCPECGAELHTMTIAERNLLPDDTVLVKNRYIDPSGRHINSAIVLSGRERSSIHRPELCLVGQGNQISRTTVIDIPLPGREPMKVKVLDMTRRIKVGDTEHVFYSYYAYWFVGKDRETASHVMRMIYMGTDRIFKNVAHRWAYISVGSRRKAEGTEHFEEIKDFIAELYPEISLI